jgi:hypothetical protein
MSAMCTSPWQVTIEESEMAGLKKGHLFLLQNPFFPGSFGGLFCIWKKYYAMHRNRTNPDEKWAILLEWPFFSHTVSGGLSQGHSWPLLRDKRQHRSPTLPCSFWRALFCHRCTAKGKLDAGTGKAGRGNKAGSMKRILLVQQARPLLGFLNVLPPTLWKRDLKSLLNSARLCTL